ncbi:serine/threonine-protein kinase [Actinopolyspora mortivallis]|uniref:non-specific serine/threonine protein kinase n=1 Tax=Actinopolyspora mortivallis TaxID=33906 RepID=A0A2T0GRQ0_ACTMO|nr:serine/threonine-protein kinase [Actinopolyspora mortivallis]PRW61786.1 serine/threonine protein kinase [Actinopolyspora mortivallis]
MSDEGRLVAGRYRVQRRIGSGAMGVVWECLDERLQRTVAVKQLVMQPGLNAAEAEEARQRAMREGRIAARLQHPHAVSVYDVAEEDGQPVLVMEYLPSTSLAAMMSEHGPLPPREVARIGAQVADALGAAHAVGVVHRDIKPGNLLLGQDGTVKITDFGISRAQGDVSVTQTGMLAGTPAYLSPDVACGREPTGASDVFSLGATLYAAIEGAPPFGQSENTLALLHAVAAGKMEPPRQSGPMTEPLLAMLRTNSEERPDMAQVRQMLQTVAEGHEVTSVPSRPTPIPPAMAPGTAATEAVRGSHDGGTMVAESAPDDGLYSDGGTREAAAYLGSDTRAEMPVGAPKRSKAPWVIGAVVLVAVLAAGTLVVTSLLTGEDGEPSAPAGGTTTTRPAPTSTVDTDTPEPELGGYPEEDYDEDSTPERESDTQGTTSVPSSVPESSVPESEPPEDDTGETTSTTETDNQEEGSDGENSGDDGSGEEDTGGGGTNPSEDASPVSG